MIGVAAIDFFAAGQPHSVNLNGQGVLNYWMIVGVMMTGMYLVLARGNMVKTIIGLNLFQVSVIMFYVSMGRVSGGTAPILLGDDAPPAHEQTSAEHGALQQNAPEMVFLADTKGAAATIAAAQKPKKKPQIRKPSKEFPTQGEAMLYSNPLPHVLMLTAIVVGVATTALALSLVVRINEYEGSIEEDELEQRGALT